MGRLSSLILKRTAIIFSLAAGLTVWSGLSQASSPNKALSLLERMSESLQEKSYQGTFVFRRGEELSAMRVTHTVGKDGEQEIIVTLTGQEREIVRDNRRFGVFGGSDEGLSKRLFANVEKSYRLELLGLDRVAGRYASLVKVTPLDDYRYGYRLWLDSASGLLLKSELLDEDRVLEQVMFTSIELLPEEAVVDSGAKSAVPADSQPAPTLEESRWAVSDLPEGFVLSNLRKADETNGVEHMVFTDGFASVSVFIESVEKPEKSFIGYSRLGAVNAYGAVVSGHQVTVVGEVPKAAVKRIGGSLKLKQ